MIIYPAIDLRRGSCVRLEQGRRDKETVFGQDPAAVAQRWQSHGARWLHVVNLDGAFADEGDESANLVALRAILEAVDIPVQFGGGLRTMDAIDRVIEMGVSRAILGTVALKEPQVLTQALAAHGAARVAVGIDARDGMVATHGWERVSETRAVDLAARMATLGVRRIIYTDIARDGMLTGVNVESTARLARESGLGIIASGGVAALSDIGELARHAGIEGAIIGRALYTGDIHLPDAIAAAQRATRQEAEPC
jgi:phosphoribosylformimino-5-aminoimidazole carboxamide ribotide isomerase